MAKKGPALETPPTKKAPIPKIVSSTPTSTGGRLMFYRPDTGSWKDLKPVIPPGTDEAGEQKILMETKTVKDELKTLLLSSLQMQHVVVLSGSGTSLGPITKGPSMWTLWDYCVNSNPGNGDHKRNISAEAKKVIDIIGFDLATEMGNIESLLSRCEAYLLLNTIKEISDFIIASKRVILSKCSEFLDPSDQNQLLAHRSFLHKLSRRRVRDSRLKLFTTNYDLCFEIAAGLQGLVVVDGFSFSQPRHFDPRYFTYDIVRRPSSGDEIGTPLEGVFHIYKLHGSVNWSRSRDGRIELISNPEPDSACIVYPAKGKYQQSYIQPHLELISKYLSDLRQPNTCLIVSGFGFNDDHLAEPILSAVQSNPNLRLILVDPLADDITSGRKPKNKYWESLFQYAKQGDDVAIINATFSDFVELLPDLKSLTPGQKLANDIKLLAGR